MQAKLRKLAFPAAILAGLVMITIASVYGYVRWRDYHLDNDLTREMIATLDKEEQLLAVSLSSLKAQQEMAEWSYTLHWIGLISLIASVGGIGLVLMNFLALSEQNKMARHFGQAQTQPYLTVGTPAVFRQTGNVNGNPNIRQCELEVELINSGATPAIDVQVYFAFYFTTEFHNFTRREHPDAEFERLDLAPLAASRSTSLTAHFSVSNNDLQINPEMRDGNCDLAFAILVLYRDVGHQTMHELCVEVSTTDRLQLNRGFRTLELKAAQSTRWFISPPDHAEIVGNYSNPDR